MIGVVILLLLITVVGATAIFLWVRFLSVLNYASKVDFNVTTLVVAY